MDTVFEQNFLEMTTSVKGTKGYSRKVKAMLVPNYEIESQAHETALKDGRSCGCRVCYWARGRK